MRRLLHAIWRRMVLKVFLALSVVVGATLFSLAWQQSDAEMRALKDETRESAHQIANLIIGSVEHAMLQGDGVVVKDLVERVKASVPEAEVNVYDPRGLEVFAAPPPPPDPKTVERHLAQVLKEGRRIDTAAGSVLRPIPNEERCHSCHAKDVALRGVLELWPGDGVKREEALARIVEAGFIQVMTANHKELLDEYFAELSRKTPSIVAAGIYDREGDLSFGHGSLDAGTLSAALVPGAPVQTLLHGEVTTVLVPQRLIDRCVQCHKDQNPVRGVLAISLRAASDPREEAESAIDTTLRTIMMSSLGRMIASFLETVVETGVAREIRLYDAAGRTYFSTEPKPAPQHIRAALETGTGTAAFLGAGLDERVRVAQPLANAGKCITCHGKTPAVRGVVTVSLSTRAAATVRKMARQRTLLFMGAALAGILGLLYALLRFLVLSPVQQIGDVADQVGHGNLGVLVRLANPEGDEVRRLGSRINDMITGLRTEFQLRRFVSKGTVDAVRDAAQATSTRDVSQDSERTLATILFTDIRGFTAYSETVPPERVVAMLNRYLQAQADIVEKHQGDIDKYVGDELMAVFYGPGAAARAVACSLEMIEAIESIRRPEEPLHVGAGISCGEVVSGPIGSKTRMDFTVIGDVVNIGARICSAAAPGQVIVSAAVKQACDQAPALVFSPLPPMSLKGKREPFAVFQANKP
jgi:adenylate cyclase